MSSNERYVVDADGERVSVLIDIASYQQLLDAVEELAAIRAFDEAKAANDPAIPFEEAVTDIERRR